MKKIYKLICGLLFILLSLHTNATVENVSAADFSFTPSSFTITLGDTIIWTLISGTHGIATLSVPEGSSTFNSPIMTVIGQTFMFIPLVQGSYTYQCSVHGSIMPGNFTVMSVVGISEPSLNWLIHAYPNPFNDKFNIDIQGVEQIDVFNLIGKRVKTSSTSLSNTQVEMDLTGLPAGIYFYNGYKDGKIVETQKIIKVK